MYNLSTLQLKKENKDIYLTEGENKLLNKLILKKNEMVLREELAESDFDENELRKIDVQVNRLRQKIENNPKQPHFLRVLLPDTKPLQVLQETNHPLPLL